MIKGKENSLNKQTLTPDVVCRVEWSGNRANAWDTDGVKRTSEITTGARRRAFEGGYLLGDNTQWKNTMGDGVSAVFRG